MLRAMSFIATFAALSGCGGLGLSKPSVVAAREVDQSFEWDTARWRGAQQLSVTTAMRFVPSPDGLLLCGAYGFNTGSVSQAADRIFSGAAVRVDGTTVLRNFSFFPRYGGIRNDADMLGRQANCASMGAVPQDADIEFVWGNGDIRG